MHTAITVFAHCPPDQLCDQCVADGLAQLRGVAAVRGELWAASVARRWPTNQPWPRTERARRIAIAKVADLTPDPRLRETLATELERWAERTWGVRDSEH